MTEEWRAVPDFVGAYEVSDLGRVRSLRFDPPKVIWQGLKSDGYPYVRLWQAGKLYTFKTHRLVCRAFIGEQPNALHNEVGHLDGNRTNARADNLKWVGKVENHFHRRAHGTIQAGEKHPRAKLSEASAIDILDRARVGNFAALAREYGISRGAVGDIVRGRRWKHIRRRGAL